jgi:hypothetical protein
VGYEKAESGARKYFTMPSYEVLCDVMMNKPRYWHEYVFPTKPVKVYADLDDKSKRPDWDAFLERFIAKVKEMLSTTHPEEKEIVRVWHAHTEEKFSAHVIWPEVWFEPARLAAFMRHAYDELGRDARLDLGPYTTNEAAIKSFRMPYCCKRGKNVPLLLAPELKPEFDRALFLESLLQHGTPTKVITAEAPVMLFAEPSSRVDDDPTRNLAVDAIEQWIRAFWGVKSIAKLKPLQEDGTWAWRLRPGVWCEMQQRKHASNETMLRGRLIANALVEVELMCLDPQCMRWVVYRNDNFGKIAFN